MGGTVTVKDLGLDKVEKTRLEHENQLLRDQLDLLRKFISQRWIIDIEKVDETVEEYMSKAEIDSIKFIQGKLTQHDFVMDELDRFETNMMEEFKRTEELFNYGSRIKEKERKAEVS